MTLDEAIERYTSNAEYERTHGSLQGCMDFKQLAEWLKDYKRLLDQEPCGDTISRQAVIGTIYDNKSDFKNDFAQGFFADRIRELPPVTPQTKTGHWIYKQYDGYPECGNWHCSECDNIDNRTLAYCPHCGCAMVEPQESIK